LDKMAVMLVGDFNISSQEPAYRKVKKILGSKIRVIALGEIILMELCQA
jgi:endonuclease/exonuclease/phosphatase family metal-dependent hydrolase